MRPTLRALILSLLLLSVGCKTTGGKVFATAGVAAGIASGYLMLSSMTGSSIENGELVERDDHGAAGVGMLAVAGLAVMGAAISETFFSPYSGGGGGGGYWPPPAEPVAPAEPVVELDPEDEGEVVHGGPPVTVVQERSRGERRRFHRVWRVDPGDGQHKLYAPRGELIGRIDLEGHVWNGSGLHIGQVDMTLSCGISCKRLQARKMLLGFR
jgi:hypothetical protein